VNNASYLLAELEPMSGLQVSVIYTSDVYEWLAVPWDKIGGNYQST
jgi:hypothetical protein